MIFARSPYIVTIDEAAQEATRLELFIWNGTGAAPIAPTYSLSKKVPSINNLETYYNIAPFIREFFNFIYSNPYTSSETAVTPNEYAYCNVSYKRYYTLDGDETLIDTITSLATDGFGYFEDAYNYTGQTILLSDLSNYGGQNIYYYPCEIGANTLLDPGTITLITNSSGWKVRYTSPNTSPIETAIDVSGIYNVRKVDTTKLTTGNKFEILLNNVVQETYYFTPQCECRYEIYTVDFINRFGAWQREFFYKVSNETIETENTKFKLNPVPFPNYDLQQGQYKNFNTNAKRSYKLNTGWVNENFKQVVEELLLSETIRVNDLPALLRTKSVEKFKSINTKTINYQMEFEMAYDVINSIS
jgi:hypothetical protein